MRVTIDRTFILGLLLSSALIVSAGCKGGDDAGKPAGEGVAPAAGQEAQPTIQEMSADAKSCLDQVKAKSYAQAIATCQSAVKAGANADLDKALAEAKAAVAKEAESAAMKAATDKLGGKPSE